MTGNDETGRDRAAHPRWPAAIPPFPFVAPAADADLARLDNARHFWQRPEVRQWLATGKWPDEDEGAGDEGQEATSDE